jgi:flagellar motor protein MotB
MIFVNRLDKKQLRVFRSTADQQEQNRRVEILVLDF